MTTIKNSKDVIVVNCHEIPETICVETRFVTQSVVRQLKNEQVFFVTNNNGSLELTKQENQLLALNNNKTLSKPSVFPLNIQAKQPPIQVPTTQLNQSPLLPQPIVVPLAAAVASQVPGKSLHPVAIPLTTHTLNLNNSCSLGTSIQGMTPIRCDLNYQIQQIGDSAQNVKSIGIQCKLDEELDEFEVEWPIIIEEPKADQEKAEIESYLKFMKNNSVQHKNYRECLKCGEISKSNKHFYKHMAIHRGVKTLCYKCGQYLDNENVQHNCRRSRKLEKAFLQCPHHSCSVVALSRLELYDHINEHTNNRMYKCSGCRKGFCTGQEFLRHLLIRAKCYTSSQSKRFRVYGLETQKDRLCHVRVFTLHTFKKKTILVKTFLSRRVAKQGVCKICLRSFANKSVFNRHRVKCIMKFRKRLIRKDKTINK